MDFYWENNLIKKTNSKSKSGLERLVFVPNLKLFIYKNIILILITVLLLISMNKMRQDAWKQVVKMVVFYGGKQTIVRHKKIQKNGI